MDDFDFDDDEDEGGGEGWLSSYSDMMTDLLAIFVVLFSFAMISQAKFSSDAAISVKHSDHAQGEITAVEGTVNYQKSLNSFLEALRAYIEEEGLSDMLSVSEYSENVVLLRMSDSALFDSGKADIRQQSEELLSSISGILIEYEALIQMVRIEGHMDNRPINTRQYKSNWQLSTDRAVNVLQWLIEASSLGEEKFSAVGYSEYHPVADNDTEEGRALNRRVDFIIETGSVESADLAA